MSRLVKRRFSWRDHSRLIVRFHEDIMISNTGPRYMSKDQYLKSLRRSKEDGSPVYITGLRSEYMAGKDGMFVWEISGEVVAWSWLKIHRNEFFQGGSYGEINEIYVVDRWRGQGIGRKIMRQAFGWFKARRIRTIRVEALASNKPAVKFYRSFGFKPNYISFQRNV